MARLLGEVVEGEERAPRVPGKPRHKTREVRVGGVVIGGTNPVVVQSMTTTDTFDVEGTVKQIHALEEAGCELVRVTVPKPEDAGALTQIILPSVCRRAMSGRTASTC